MKITVPNERQAQLIRSSGIDPDTVGVDHECDRYIILLHYKGYRNITITKNERDKRAERELGLWRMQNAE